MPRSLRLKNALRLCDIMFPNKVAFKRHVCHVSLWLLGAASFLRRKRQIVERALQCRVSNGNHFTSGANEFETKNGVLFERHTRLHFERVLNCDTSTFWFLLLRNTKVGCASQTCPHLKFNETKKWKKNVWNRTFKSRPGSHKSPPFYCTHQTSEKYDKF